MFIQLTHRRFVPIASIDDVCDLDGAHCRVRRTNGETITLAGDDAERVLDIVSAGKRKKPKLDPVVVEERPVVQVETLPPTNTETAGEEPPVEESADNAEETAQAEPAAEKPKRSRKKAAG